MGSAAPTTHAKILNAASLLMTHLMALRNRGFHVSKLYARGAILLSRALTHALFDAAHEVVRFARSRRGFTVKAGLVPGMTKLMSGPKKYGRCDQADNEWNCRDIWCGKTGGLTQLRMRLRRILQGVDGAFSRHGRMRREAANQQP
jgi:hypothetical protein